MSGRKSKDKGYRFENNSRKFWTNAGFNCKRMPLSGALGGDHSGDLELEIGHLRLKGQLKCKADGFKGLYSTLHGHGFAELKADNRPVLFVVERDTLIQILNEVALNACEGMVQFGSYELGKPFGPTGDNQ